MEWTQQNCEQLRVWWTRDGLSSSEIATRFNITRSSVMGKANRLGLLGTRRGTVENRAKLAESAKAARFAAKMAYLRRKAEASKVAAPVKIKAPAKKPEKRGTVTEQVVPGLESSPVRVRLTPRQERPDEGGGKPWTERRYGQCCYPTQGRGADTFYCCETAPDGRYCQKHAELCYEAVRGPSPRPDYRFRKAPVRTAVSG